MLKKDYEAKLEAKNEIIIAEMDRKTNEEKEKQLRDEMLSSQQQQQESVAQMKKELMDAITM